MNLVDRIVQFHHEIRDIRRDIHAHPELRFEEQRTADLVAARLEQWGIPVMRGLGRTGVVGTIRNGSSERSIGLRADMDALPMQEHNEFEHRSRNHGKMHACGHDGHTAMLLAAAKYLAEHRNFDGTVHLIFQPAEEGGAGAQRMIDDGLFEKAPCDAVFGMHNWPGFKVGQFGVRAGPMLASSNEFTITIGGKGAHAALPHNGTDPVLVATHVVQAMQSIITRNKKPIDSAVLSVTQIHGGDAYNVIPDTATICGTVRTFSVEVLDLIESRMRQIVEQLPLAFGASGSLNFHRNYPPLINHPEQTEFAREVLADVVGAENVQECEPTMGAEDFAFMLMARPGCYVFAGNGEGGHREAGHGAGPCMLHNPSYDFNDDLIPVGATYWVRLAEKYLTKS
jgi:amidohydrolase